MCGGARKKKHTQFHFCSVVWRRARLLIGCWMTWAWVNQLIPTLVSFLFFALLQNGVIKHVIWVRDLLDFSGFFNTHKMVLVSKFREMTMLMCSWVRDTEKKNHLWKNHLDGAIESTEKPTWTNFCYKIRLIFLWTNIREMGFSSRSCYQLPY